MRIALIVAASTAALALSACKPADDTPEVAGDPVEAAAVTDPAAFTWTEEQAPRRRRRGRRHRPRPMRPCPDPRARRPPIPSPVPSRPPRRMTDDRSPALPGLRRAPRAVVSTTSFLAREPPKAGPSSWRGCGLPTPGRTPRFTLATRVRHRAHIAALLDLWGRRARRRPSARPSRSKSFRWPGRRRPHPVAWPGSRPPRLLLAVCRTGPRFSPARPAAWGATWMSRSAMSPGR